MSDLIYNTYENDIKIYGDFELPVPTYDFEIDFRVIISLLLRSNANINESETRYIEYSRLNMDEICKELQISKKTLDRKLKILEEKGIITKKNNSNGLIYSINYSKNGKYFVTIQHKILVKLLEKMDKNAIKLYILLKIQCDLLKNSRAMSNIFLCEQLGYSIKSKKNIDNIGKWSNELEKNGFIEKNQIRRYKEKNNKKVIKKIDTYYKIIS